MSVLTKILCFSKVAIDNIYKFVYNVKGYLCAGAIFIALILVWSELALPSAAHANEGVRDVSVELSKAMECADGIVDVEVSFKEQSEAAGLIASLKYDANEFAFSSAELDQALADRGFVLSVNDLGGELLFVIDGSENIPSKGLVSFAFEPVEKEFSSVFELSAMAVFAWQGDDLVELEVSSETVSLMVSAVVVGERPSLLSVSLDGDLYGTRLKVSGSAYNCFAAGFDVLTVNLSTFESESFSSMSALPLGTLEKKLFSQSLPLCDGDRLCVIVKPVAFVGRRVVRGEEKIFMIDSGVIIY